MKKKRATITDIARELNISPSTVSRALHDHPAINVKTKKAVVALAKKLNYHPNLQALNLLRKRTNTIGVIVPEITSYFFSAVINGIQHLFNPLGYNVIIAQSNESFAEECQIIDTLMAIQVDGFLISPSFQTTRYDKLKKIVDSHIPLVIFDRDCAGIKVDKVFVDEYQGAFQAVDYLAKSGCRRIAHIAGPASLSTSKHRLRGYLDALRENNMDINEDFIISCKGFLPEHGIKPVRRLLNFPEIPDGIFAFNDGVAIGAMSVIKDKGIRIPEDISVIGFDDDPHSSYFKPSLTTVMQPTYELGLLSARILNNRINEESPSALRLETLFPELLVRGSSRKK
ncbi:MAG: LacI family DNA-binding transcriptional regulator [Marinilabiliaceae bacterium]|nr:LacI family DNA-binding transcriptional regulator [Marinilabiliaceae bacterium]